MNKIISNILGVIGITAAVICIAGAIFMVWCIWDSKQKDDAHRRSIPYKIIYRDTCSIKPLIKDSL